MTLKVKASVLYYILYVMMVWTIVYNTHPIWGRKEEQKP